MAKYKVDITGINTAKLNVLTNSETLNLIKKYRDGESSARDRIIMGNLKLVLSTIKNFSSRIDNQDDIFQIGCIGLIKAIDNFNFDYNLQFSTYAVPMIIGEIRRYLRDNTMIRVSRQIKDLAYRALKEKEKYQEINCKEIEDNELALKLGVNLNELKLALDSTNSVGSLYDTVYKDDEDDLLLIDQIKDEEINTNNLIDILTLKEAFNSLNSVQKKVINDRYYLGKTQFEIANEFNISQAQVSRIEKSAIKNIRHFFY